MNSRSTQFSKHICQGGVDTLIYKVPSTILLYFSSSPLTHSSSSQLTLSLSLSHS